MKKIALLTVLLVSVAFIVPSHALRQRVKIINKADDPVWVAGDMTIIDDTARKTIRSGYAFATASEPTQVLLTVSAGKTFILTDIVGDFCNDCNRRALFWILEGDTVKFTMNFDFVDPATKTQSVHLNSGVPFASGSDVVLGTSNTESGASILITGYEIDN